MKLTLAFVAAVSASDNGTCRISATSYGGVNPTKATYADMSASQCAAKGKSDLRESPNGSVQAQWQNSLKQARELNAFGRTGVRCLFKPVNCANMPSQYRSVDVVANDRSKGWDVLGLNHDDCLTEVGKMADACGNSDAVILARPEAGSLCAHNRHFHANGKGWCQGDLPSAVAKQPWEPGYGGAEQGTHANEVKFGDRALTKMHHGTTGSDNDPNLGDECFGGGCAAYKTGDQVCKHFTCQATAGRTSVAGFLNSNEKYHCEQSGDSCVCKCHPSKECSMTHGSITTKGHCKVKPGDAPVDNCQITFNDGCPDEDSTNQFSDEFRNHIEHAKDETNCHARATYLRKACFKHPTDVTGYGSVTASFDNGVATPDVWSKLCAIKFSGTGVDSCPAKSSLFTAGENKWWKYSNHVEQFQGQGHDLNGELPLTEQDCFDRATELRKACYMVDADGEGDVTAEWLEGPGVAPSQITDSWQNVCSIQLDSCPDVAGEVPEGLKTHVTMDSVVIKIKNVHHEGIGGNPATFIDTHRLLARLGRAESEKYDVVETVEQMTRALCDARAEEVHSQCFRTTAGVVTAKFLPDKSQTKVGTSTAAVDYWTKTPQGLTGQDGCMIDYDVHSGEKCPRAFAENQAVAWDQKDHTEWTLSTQQGCLQRATDLYNYCFFWPGADKELDNYINKDNQFVGRPDLFYPGTVTATWLRTGAYHSECTGDDCETYQHAQEYFAAEGMTHTTGKAFKTNLF